VAAIALAGVVGMSDSELHVVYVAEDPSIALLYPEATDPEGVEM
jgi:hypothetical protein